MDSDVHAGLFGKLAVRAIGGNIGIDQPGIDLAEALVVQAKPAGDTGAEVLHHDIGPPGELFADFAALGCFQPEADGALVAVDGDEVIAADPGNIGVKTFAHVHVAGGVAALGLLDFDDVAAKIAQHHRAIGAGNAVRQVQDLQSFQESAHRVLSFAS